MATQRRHSDPLPESSRLLTEGSLGGHLAGSQIPEKHYLFRVCSKNHPPSVNPGAGFFVYIRVLRSMISVCIIIYSTVALFTLHMYLQLYHHIYIYILYNIYIYIYYVQTCIPGIYKYIFMN